MDFLTLCTKARLTREHRSDAVSRGTIEWILEAARQAPSAENRQPWRFIVVTDLEIQNGLKKCYPRRWFVEADLPVVVVACGVPSKSQHKRRSFYVEEYFEDYWKVDVAIACEHIVRARRRRA